MKKCPINLSLPTTVLDLVMEEGTMTEEGMETEGVTTLTKERSPEGMSQFLLVMMSLTATGAMNQLLCGTPEDTLAQSNLVSSLIW